MLQTAVSMLTKQLSIPNSAGAVSLLRYGCVYSADFPLSYDQDLCAASEQPGARRGRLVTGQVHYMGCPVPPGRGRGRRRPPPAAAPGARAARVLPIPPALRNG